MQLELVFIAAGNHNEVSGLIENAKKVSVALPNLQHESNMRAALSIVQPWNSGGCYLFSGISPTAALD